MEGALRGAVEALIGDKTGESSPVASATAVDGGCISAATMVELADGRRFFVKSNADPLPGMFEREAEALSALAEVGALRAPRPVGTAQTPLPLIVMEHIVKGAQGRDFSARFGRGFAELHRRGRAERVGFEHDNYIGSTTQPNGWNDSWVDFWRHKRLGHQLGLARSNGYADAEMSSLGDALLERLDELIGAKSGFKPSLLHGDLWGGNYLCDEHGQPVLIDPASYYGHREADLAMTYCFGGFDHHFYEAYQETWPLEPGWRERVEVYKLYHFLNHLNLFGPSYRQNCLSILHRFA
ncbi:MAG: fructosamine kinase family protein [Deltaproteobacteria bacterium]|nr:fructosamine kinase family protein [Deltaproteobacteria bacterium]